MSRDIPLWPAVMAMALALPLAVSLTLGLSACGSSDDDDASAASSPTPTPTAPPATACTAEMKTCAAVRDQVFQGSCGLSSSCHTGPKPAGGMNLTDDPCGHDVVGVTPENPEAAADGLLRVKPGSLEQSFVWIKVNTDQNAMPSGYGERMPPPNLSSDLLSQEKRRIIQCWIEAGAPVD